MDFEYGKENEFEDDYDTSPIKDVFPEPETYYPGQSRTRDWDDFLKKRNLDKKKEIAVKLFFDKINKLQNNLLDYDEFLKNTNFYIADKGIGYALFLKIGLTDIKITKQFDNEKIQFYCLTEIAQEINRIYGRGGVEAVKKL